MNSSPGVEDDKSLIYCSYCSSRPVLPVCSQCLTLRLQKLIYRRKYLWEVVERRRQDVIQHTWDTSFDGSPLTSSSLRQKLGRRLSLISHVREIIENLKKTREYYSGRVLILSEQRDRMRQLAFIQHLTPHGKIETSRLTSVSGRGKQDDIDSEEEKNLSGEETAPLSSSSDEESLLGTFTELTVLSDSLKCERLSKCRELFSLLTQLDVTLDKSPSPHILSVSQLKRIVAIWLSYLDTVLPSLSSPGFLKASSAPIFSAHPRSLFHMNKKSGRPFYCDYKTNEAELTPRIAPRLLNTPRDFSESKMDRRMDMSSASSDVILIRRIMEHIRRTFHVTSTSRCKDTLSLCTELIELLQEPNFGEFLPCMVRSLPNVQKVPLCSPKFSPSCSPSPSEESEWLLVEEEENDSIQRTP